MKHRTGSLLERALDEWLLTRSPDRDHEARSVLSSGYVALDVVRDRDKDHVWIGAGGTAANVAANLAFWGWSAGVLGRLGGDYAGIRVEADLKSGGVDTTWLRLDPAVRTPVILYEIAEGTHTFRFGCSECGRPRARHRSAKLDDINGKDHDILADVFFFDRANPATLHMASLHSTLGRLVYYEPSTAGRPELHRQAALLADVVKYSDERAPAFETTLPDPGPHQLRIVTSSHRGARFRIGQGRWREGPPYLVDVVDAGGAGDWMTATLLDVLPAEPQRWNERNVAASLAFAQAVAALNCLVPGARSLAGLLDRSGLIDQLRRLALGLVPEMTPSPAILRSESEDVCRRCSLPVRGEV